MLQEKYGNSHGHTGDGEEPIKPKERNARGWTTVCMTGSVLLAKICGWAF